MTVSMGRSGDPDQQEDVLDLEDCKIASSLNLIAEVGKTLITVARTEVQETLDIVCGGRANGINYASDDEIKVSSSQIRQMKISTGSGNDVVLLERNKVLVCFAELGDGHDILDSSGNFFVNYLCDGGAGDTDSLLTDDLVLKNFGHGQFEYVY